ncbi:MAG TPA: hypothetical protein VF166_14310 [Gemmatimonadaceae bacterium]
MRIDLVRAHLPRRVGAALLLVALLAPTVVRRAHAQSSSTSSAVKSSRTPRSRALAILGTVVGGLVGFGFTYAAGQRGASRCGPIHCPVYVWAAAGGLAGYFIGRQYDKNFAMYYRGATPLSPKSVDADLNGRPAVLAANDSVVAVGGSDGVEMFQSTALTSIGHRARGLHGIDALALAPVNGSLVLGSQAGLYLFPPHQGPGRLVRAGDVRATVASADRVYFSVDDRLEIAPLAADSAHPWPGIAVGAPVRDAALDTTRHLLWTITDGALIAFRVGDDSLERIGSVPVTGGAQRLAILGNRAAVAVGENGVLLYDISVPEAPRQTAHWSTARFAYDVSLDGTRLFVAAGPEGVYVVDVSRPEPRTIGLARSLGFATALVSRGGSTYIVDRRENALRRIPSDF